MDLPCVIASIRCQESAHAHHQVSKCCPAYLWAGCVENELGLRKFLEDRGHTYIVTDDKEGDSSELDRHLPDTDVVRPLPVDLIKAQNVHVVTATPTAHHSAL